MTDSFIVIQYPYDFIEIALCSETKIIEQIEIHKFEVIKLLIPTIKNLFSKHNVRLEDLVCIGINRGPGPYNTLRSIIATINGFHFTHKIKFAELKALSLLLKPYKEPTVALLNAFSKRAYYGIKIEDNVIQGICPIVDLPKILREHGLMDQKISCVGNGAVVYKDELTQLAPNLETAKDLPLFNTLQTAVEETYKQIQEKKLVSCFTSPLYFN